MTPAINSMTRYFAQIDRLAIFSEQLAYIRIRLWHELPSNGA